MIRSTLLFFLGTMLFLVSSKVRSQSSGKQFKPPGDIILLAWNEDTVHNFQFTLLRNQHFAYTIIENGSDPIEKTYYGKWIYRSFSDTLLLRYYKNNHPPGFTNFLIREADGHYLIQHFTNSPKLVFLRLQQIHFRY